MHPDPVLDVVITTDLVRDQTRWEFRVTNLGTEEARDVQVAAHFVEPSTGKDRAYGVFDPSLQDLAQEQPLVPGATYVANLALDGINETVPTLLRRYGRYYVIWTDGAQEYRQPAQAVFLDGVDIGNYGLEAKEEAR